MFVDDYNSLMMDPASITGTIVTVAKPATSISACDPGPGLNRGVISISHREVPATYLDFHTLAGFLRLFEYIFGRG